MKNVFFRRCDLIGIGILLLMGGGNVLRVHANPVGGTVTQGAATFSTSGSQFTINQTTADAFINWQSFNIAAGETTTFNQPSANSVTWNFINDPGAPSGSSIDGNLNANGYVILQNPNGFTIGGNAVISTRGLIMTTASTPAIDLSSGGPWSFNTPPPTAQIINYGQINVANGGSVFLIANDIENNGAISAPGGKVGLYAGKTVLVSTSPDGRGLSAQVTLPQGSVDNEGKLAADAGSIVLKAAKIVNQSGLIQANSAQNVNGTIELVGSDSVSLGANSVLSAQGDTAGTSQGGSVTIQSGNTFSDQSGSVINVAGGTRGGNGGQVMVSAPRMAAFQSTVKGQANAGYADGSLSIDTSAITLNSDGSPAAGSLALNANSSSWFSDLSQINLEAAADIELSALWNLIPKDNLFGPAVSLKAGSTITVDPGAGITADAGKIALNATTVNQNGTLQSDSVQGASGGVEIDASSAANLGANSVTSANGDTANASPGGAVTIHSGTITVDNGAGVEAAAGKIALNATTVNQNGTLRANSIQDARGAIDVNASGTANLGANSVISANGDTTAASPGGSVTIHSGTITLEKGAGVTADGGKIALNADTVNQDGALQANSIQNAGGTIDINASSAANLGANSAISANGDTAGVSAGGSVAIQSGNSFSDQNGSVINVAGGAQGGNGGQLSISAPQMSAFQSLINGQASAGYLDAGLSIDTAAIALNSDGNPVAGQLALNVNDFSAGLSQINLQAAGNITLAPDSLTANPLWNLTPKNGAFGSTVSLTAGNTLTVEAGAGIEADAGKIVLNAPTVDQYGTLQANSIGSVNGIVEVNANDSLNLGAHSVISAVGDSSSGSPGGFVVLKSDKSFADKSGSTISVAGGTSGGQSGIIEVFDPRAGASPIQSKIIGNDYAYLINPNTIYLSTGKNTSSSSSPSLKASDLSAYSQIDLQALGDIDLETPSGGSVAWNLPGSTVPTAAVNLTAGGNINLANGSTLNAGNNWGVNLTAGNGIYLSGNSHVQAQNGNINLYALNEVQVGWSGQSPGVGIANSGNGFIATVGGGNIDVTAVNGDVNTGTGRSQSSGFTFSKYLGAKPFTAGNGCGISTAAGGNVSITAGGDVVSFLPSGSVSPNNSADAGTGAFGSQPGNVTITAGGSVYGHYVVANGTGIITAGQDVGNISQNIALSLINGGWNLTAQQGSIYLQEVRNPNGVFNNFGGSPSSRFYHLFNYDPQAWVDLTAANGGVYFTGQNLPRPTGGSDNVPIILPPILQITAGPGGVNLEAGVTLFPSSYQDLQISTADGGGLNGNGNELLMSDSGKKQWYSPYSGISGPTPFGNNDHAAVPPELNDYNPVLVNIAGSMNNIILQTDNKTLINVAGDMTGCSFYGANLHPYDVTSITVGGRISSAGSFTSVNLNQPITGLPAEDIPFYLPQTAVNSWDAILLAAINPNSPLLNQDVSSLENSAQGLANLQTALQNARLFPTINPSSYLAYNPSTGKLTAIGPMPFSLLLALESPTLTVVRYYPNGTPILDSNGHLETDTYYNYLSGTPPANAKVWIPYANFNQIASLYTESQAASSLGSPAGAYVVGGPGWFDVSASSISLGNASGILSVGNAGTPSSQFLSKSYSFLTPYITSGATINVTVGKDYTDQNGVLQSSLEMPSSTIAALGGGDVNVTSTGGSMDLGSSDLAEFEGQIMSISHIALGIYTSAGGNVNVTAPGDINIDTSRIASFNGGDVLVESYGGNIDAGSGSTTSKLAVPVQIFDSTFGGQAETVYANGIAAETLVNPALVPGSAAIPGNITVWTPYGSIFANLGGIKQEVLNGTAPVGPTITLTAGTPAIPGDFNSSLPPLFLGNIELGTVGVIGETVIAQATGKITGLVLSKHNASVTSQTVGSLTVLAGGTANVTAQSSGSGTGITIIGGAGVNASGIGSSAILLGNNVSVNGGAAQSTIGTSATATSASQSAAGQTSSENQQQVASNSNEEGKKKKKKKKAELVRSVGRVTVILPKQS